MRLPVVHHCCTDHLFCVRSCCEVAHLTAKLFVMAAPIDVLVENHDLLIQIGIMAVGKLKKSIIVYWARLGPIAKDSRRSIRRRKKQMKMLLPMMFVCAGHA